ncbi:hypothetical protein VB773_00900 [Haloarculaceae archaeon H-GB2-1]|nr:hypothetical protein [Haloarculaceae archaeon H-GB2-1]
MLALPGLLAQSAFVREWLASIVGAAPIWLQLGGVVVTVVPTVPLSLWSFRSAVGTVDGYRL